MKPIGQPDHYWSVKRGSVTLCHGPRETLPSSAQRKQLCADGYQVVVDGKVSKGAAYER